MNFRATILCGAVLLAGQAWSAESADVKKPAAELSAPSDKLSYAIGANIGKNLKKESPEVDLAVLMEAIKASFGAEPLRLSDKDMRVILGQYQVQLRKRAVADRQKAMVENKQKGDAYLAANKAKPDVKVLPSGVQYRIVKQGDGAMPKLSDMVVVRYRGSLVNGTEFDATQGDEPLTLKLSALIPAWKDALMVMPVGSTWELVVPPDQAYGERGSGEIGPNEVLVFKLELLQIK